MVYHKALPISSVICHEIIPGKITATISHHLPQISLVPNIPLSSSTQKSNFYERDWLKLQQENFMLYYIDKYWAHLCQIDQHNLSLDSF